MSSQRIFLALREKGERCGRHWAMRIMKQHRIMAVRSYQRPRYVAGKLSVIALNRLQRESTVAEPDRVWVTGITCIRTWKGWSWRQ